MHVKYIFSLVWGAVVCLSIAVSSSEDDQKFLPLLPEDSSNRTMKRGFQKGQNDPEAPKQSEKDGAVDEGEGKTGLNPIVQGVMFVLAGIGLVVSGMMVVSVFFRSSEPRPEEKWPLTSFVPGEPVGHASVGGTSVDPNKRDKDGFCEINLNSPSDDEIWSK